MATFTVTDPKTGRQATMTSQDGAPPTEQELEQVFAGGDTTQQSSQQNKFLSDTPIEEKPSPLNLVQNLMLGLMPEESKAAYLQQEFSGRNISQDGEGLKVDGAPVNPIGPDLGDITRSLGYVAPLAGQIAGSLTAAGLATPSGPLGMAGAGFAGGVAGATTGEAARIGAGKFLLSAMGKHLDLNDEGKIFINSLVETAGAAALGETVGLGMIGAGQGLKALTKTQYYKGASDAWSKTVENLPEGVTQSALKFVGAIPEDATRIVLRDKPSVVLNEKYFDPDKTSKIASKALFGTENFYSLGSTGSNGIAKGSSDLAKSIQEVNDPAYEHLLQSLGVSKDLIDSVKSSNINNALHPINTNNPRRGFQLASKVIKEVSDQERILGQEVSKAESRAIANKKGVYFNAEDLSSKIDGIIGEGSLLKATKVPDFKSKPAMDVLGASKLKELSTILKGNRQTVTDSGVKITEKKLTPFEKIPPKQLRNIKKQFDAKVDEIFNNERIPGEIRGQVAEIAKQFRTRYYDYLDIGDEAKLYKQFKDITDGIKLEGRGSYAALENKISGFRNITGSEQDELVQALMATPRGSKIISEINDFGVSKSLKEIKPESLLKGLSGPLSSARFMASKQTDTAGEGILRDISKRLGAIEGSKASGRQFAEEAERALAAKGFLGSNQNLLRLQTLASMTGLGALMGGVSGGPLGALGGGVAALTIANPANLGRMLMMAEKTSKKYKVSNKKFTNVNNTNRNKAILSALIATKAKDSSNKDKNKK